jgi:hypothetical protein
VDRDGDVTGVVGTMISQLMLGALAMGFLVAGLFFLRFWKETRDRLFGFFALGFFVLAVNRVALALTEDTDGGRDHHYWIRLIAFVLILIAILDKNRSRRPPTS